VTPYLWALVVAFLVSAVLVVIGWYAFQPLVKDARPGRHRPEEVAQETPPTPRPEPAPVEGLVPLEPTAESWMWSAGRPAARHRWEHLAEGTQRLTWPPEDESS
jgi:hypothetical protein